MGHVELFQPKEKEREAFIKWLVQPANKRDPKTKRAIADKLGVDYSTIWRWEHDDRILKEVRKRQREKGLEEHIYDVFEALVITAKTPGRDGAADRREFFRLMGMYPEKVTKHEHRVSHEVNYNTMNDEDLIEAAVSDIISAIGDRTDMTADEFRDILREQYERRLDLPKKPDIKSIGAVDVDFEIVDE